MANEVRGILYEVIAHEALKRAVAQLGRDLEVYWNHKPAEMSIVPDLSTGTDPEQPTSITLITAYGAARNSETKSWRNLSEFFEIKAQVASMPNVLNLFFKSEVKQALYDSTQKLYDAVLHIHEKPYYSPLQKWVASNLRSVAKSREAKQDLLQNAIAQDADLAAAIDALAADLAQALQQRNIELEPLWQLMREDYLKPHNPPKARKTSVRRGLAKLMVLEPGVRQVLYENRGRARGIPTAGLPDYVYQMGFLRKHIAGARLVDDEIKGVLELLGPEKCEELIQKSPIAMRPWINDLRQLDNIPLFLNYVHERYEQICDANELSVLLNECQLHPEVFAQNGGITFRGSLERNWLFSFLIDLIKASTGRLTGYGYAQLAEELGQTKDVSSGYITVADWANRVPGVELSADFVLLLSTALAERIKQINNARVLSLGEQLIGVTQKSFLEDRLIPYRNFEPLLWLLEGELEAQGKAYAEKQAYIGWINEYSGVGRRTATTPFVQVGTTLIHWKTVSDAGKVHKKKELAARARNVKYQYHSATKTFSRRAGVEHLALIVDGTFDDQDLDILAKAGWDMIIYPDEIAEFVGTI